MEEGFALEWQLVARGWKNDREHKANDLQVKLYEADEAPEEADDGLDESAQLRSHLQEVKDRMERQNSVVDVR